MTETTGHERIWIQPLEGADEETGPSWHHVNIWGDGAFEYVLATRIESLADGLREVVRCLDMVPELKARNAAIFTAWDIATKSLTGQNYPWSYPPWRDKDQTDG